MCIRDRLSVSSCSVNEIERELQFSINEVSNWCFKNYMALNPTKTKSMLLTARQKHQNTCSNLTLLVKSELIEQVSEHRLLGVIIDNKLTWKQHIELLCKRLAKNIYLMSRLKKYSNSLALKLFFYGHIMSHIDYASIVWDGSSENNLKPLYSLYKLSLIHI